MFIYHLRLMIRSQAHAEELIATEKWCEAAPGKLNLTNNKLDTRFKLLCGIPQIVFRVFFRISPVLEEDFSCGLIAIESTSGKEVHLLRCNGVHGGNKAIAHHFQCHIHKYNHDLNSTGKEALATVEPTDRYANYQQAIQYFLKIVNLRVEERAKYFPDDQQLNLFEDA